MRGAPHYRGHKGSGLPKLHAPHPNGGALCGAKRKWGALTTAGMGSRPEQTDCAACRRKLTAVAPAPLGAEVPQKPPRAEMSDDEVFARLFEGRS